MKSLCLFLTDVAIEIFEYKLSYYKFPLHLPDEMEIDFESIRPPGTGLWHLFGSINLENVQIYKQH